MSKKKMPSVSVHFSYENALENEGVWWCVINGHIDGNADGSFAVGRGRSKAAANRDAKKRLLMIARALEE